jgi:hypothetical protein
VCTLASPGLESGARTLPVTAHRAAAEREFHGPPASSRVRRAEHASDAVSAAEPAIAGRVLAFGEDAQLELELVDAASGAAIPVAYVQRSGPGLGLAVEELRGGRGTFAVRTRLPFDLAIEAAGYEAAEVRQTKLARGESSRVLRVALRPR